MVKAKFEIDLYDAKEVHPAKDCCEVIVITECEDGSLNTLMNVRYHDGAFNGSGIVNDSTRYWGYMPSMKDIDAAFAKEDDF